MKTRPGYLASLKIDYRAGHRVMSVNVNLSREIDCWFFTLAKFPFGDNYAFASFLSGGRLNKDTFASAKGQKLPKKRHLNELL
ncbi:MAG: hypothetical protein HWN68_02350 [Desulfobacterales bacterium]|nr:hypothetical protein [Desulfobacterales bacterium]